MEELKIHFRWKIFIILSLFLVLPVHLESTVVVHKNLEDITKESSLIIKGTVTDILSEWNPEHTLIFSYITVAVNKQYKGKYYKQTVVIRQIGGNIDRYITEVSGAPKFTIGEEVVLFLKPGEGDFYYVNGMFQGKYKIEEGKAKHTDNKRTLPWQYFEQTIKDLVRQQQGQ